MLAGGRAKISHARARQGKIDVAALAILVRKSNCANFGTRILRASAAAFGLLSIKAECISGYVSILRRFNAVSRRLGYFCRLLEFELLVAEYRLDPLVEYLEPWPE